MYNFARTRGHSVTTYRTDSIQVRSSSDTTRLLCHIDKNNNIKDIKINHVATWYICKKAALPEWNIVPAKEQNCTISFRADTAIGQSSQNAWHENFCRSAAYKFKSHEMWPLETKTSHQAGPGYKHQRRENNSCAAYTIKKEVQSIKA